MIKNTLETFLMHFPVIYSNFLKIKNNTNPDKFIFLNLLKRGDLVIDGGGNIGYYSSFFCRLVGTHGQVHTFEPVEPTFNILSNTIKK